MKKAILTLGLFSMMMILTSFTSPATSAAQKKTNIVRIYEIGGDNQTKPKDYPKDLGNGTGVTIGGDTQTKPKDPPKDLGTGTGLTIGGDNQTKPKDNPKNLGGLIA